MSDQTQLAASSVPVETGEKTAPNASDSAVRGEIVSSSPRQPGAGPGSKYPWLKPFGPGHTGNAGGRKKKSELTDEITKQILAEAPGASGKKVVQLIATRLIQIAVGGNSARALRAIEIILERTEGKVTQRVEATGADGGPVKFEELGSRAEVEQRIALLLGPIIAAGVEASGAVAEESESA